MEAHAPLFHRLREHVPHLHLARRERTSAGRLAVVGAASGLGGGLVLALTLVLYDWVRASHTALELPMAVTGWLFGIVHFERNGYEWWPIVVGALFMLAYFAVLGLVFGSLADRVYHVRTLAGSLALGAAWSFVSFMFFWYMLLPIARDGAPFRETAAAGDAFAAPNWIWILAFAFSGLATGACYRALAARKATTPAASTAAERRAA
jgi:hypothetical protein